MQDDFAVKNLRINNIAVEDSHMGAAGLYKERFFLLLPTAVAFPALVRSAAEHLLKLFVAKRLNQIMESPHVKGLKHIRFRCRYKNQNGFFIEGPQPARGGAKSR